MPQPSPITSFPPCLLHLLTHGQAVGASEDVASSGSKRKSGLALSAARAWRRLVGEATDEVRWLPTGCLRLLDTLQQVGWGQDLEPTAAACMCHPPLPGAELVSKRVPLCSCPVQARPNHTLIAADFDELPEVAVAGVNAPLVASTVGGLPHEATAAAGDAYASRGRQLPAV